MRKIASNCHPQIFRFLHLKTWVDELIWLVSPYCIVFYFVLFVQSLFHSSDFFKFELQSMSMVQYYDQLVHFDKEINANVYRHSLCAYCKRFHCSFECHLTPHMTLSIETCIRRTPSIKRTLQHSPHVRLIQVSLYFEITGNLYRAINSWGSGIFPYSSVLKDEFPAWCRSCLKFSHKRNINATKKIEWIA